MIAVSTLLKIMRDAAGKLADGPASSDSGRSALQETLLGRVDAEHQRDILAMLLRQRREEQAARALAVRVAMSTGGMAALRWLALSSAWRSLSRMTSSTRSNSSSLSNTLERP